MASVAVSPEGLVLVDGEPHPLSRQEGRLAVLDVLKALAALDECCAAEGILSAIETAHALAGARRYAKHRPGSTILIGMSGRGDKDLATLIERGGVVQP